ncbi:MAG: acetyl-CoA carboxylase, carboxyltransferase subunit beta [Deltaproteobacteria bacterium]|nr:acetyl-CoA carboxylase, carboxyltransferase subunit beta [Deltaproteobacteria bacterium]MCX7952566.1 acetyl-CoA carboxylase, carboxyltransferase subunit beta [Deltaproteobacteria bacterium]
MIWFFRKKAPKPQADLEATQDVKEDLWVKCPKCESILYKKEMLLALNVCGRCNYHFKMSAKERIAKFLDEGSFTPLGIRLRSKDPLGFKDKKPYKARYDEYVQKTGLDDAVIVGKGKLENKPVCVGVMDFSFMGGSMGSVVGELLRALFEEAITLRYPVIVFSASGGARMQEGVYSLMQMAKISVAVARLAEARLPFISILTDPTTGGVAASFAFQGDIILAEPGALIGFAGRRVIEQTIRKKLPDNFQTAEFLFEKGLIDRILPRHLLRFEVATILDNLISRP